MIEGLELNIKVSLYKLMIDEYDLILFSRTNGKTKIHHITIEDGTVVTNTFPSIDSFRRDQWIDDGDLDEHIEFMKKNTPIFKVIKEKYSDVQRVAFMYH